MILDSNGLIILEQDSTLAGNTGDSCAETCRYVTMCKLLGLQNNSNVSLYVDTDNGVVRYPGVWPESDTSSDQVIPLLPCLPILLQAQVIAKIRQTYETGNGEFVTWSLFCQMRRCLNSKSQWLDDLCLVLQALVFLVPFSINFGPGNLFQPQGTADYLNFINMLAFARMRNWTWCCSLATEICSQAKVLAAVESYYKPEPNPWVIEIYKQAVPKVWE